MGTLFIYKIYRCYRRYKCYKVFSIILIIPIILILPDVNEDFEDKPDAKRALLDNFFLFLMLCFALFIVLYMQGSSEMHPPNNE